MKRNKALIYICCTAFAMQVFPVLNQSAIAGDLDDGIGIDQRISDDLKLDNNNEYIVTKATTKARQAQIKGKKDGDIVNADGTGNISIAPGADLKGATIINLSNNKGSTVVSGSK